MAHRIIYTIFFGGIAAGLWGQPTYRAGLLPQLKLNTRLTQAWQLIANLESRQILAQGHANSFEQRYEYERTEITLLVTRKLQMEARVGGGYLVRFKRGSTKHQLIQFYSVQSRYTDFRLGHRFLADQTFGVGEPPALRFRYRIDLTRALSSQTADAHEFYFKFKNEYLFTTKGAAQSGEIRLVPLLGFNFAEAGKYEVGIDYRMSDILLADLTHNFWLHLGWDYSW